MADEISASERTLPEDRELKAGLEAVGVGDSYGKPEDDNHHEHFVALL